MRTTSFKFRHSRSSSNLTKCTTISQIKRDNLRCPPIQYNFIETMYRSGGFFKYDTKPLNSTTADLQKTQNKAKDIQSKMNQHKNDLLYLNFSIKDLQYAINDNFQKLKRDLIMNGDNIEDKAKQKFNKQKVINTHLWEEINRINRNFNSMKDEVNTLKNRLSKLKSKL